MYYKNVKKQLVYISLLLMILLNGCSSKTEDAAADVSEEEITAVPSETSAADDIQAAEENGGEGIGSEKESISSQDGSLHPVVETRRSSVYGEDNVTLLSQGSSPFIYVRDEGYEALNEALALYSNENENLVNSVLAQMKEAAKEQQESFPESPSGYSLEYTVRIKRADKKIFSFEEQCYSFTGGAHGNAAVSGYTYDSSTGKLLKLDDVVSDKEGLYEYLVQSLSDNPDYKDGLFEGWEETVRQEVYEEETDGYIFSLRWTLAEDGMRVYFSPYDIGPWAMGTVTVTVPYSQENIGFSEEYLPFKEQSVWPLKPYEELQLDTDGDGQEETVRYEQTSDGNGMDLIYTVYVDESGTEINCTYGVTNAYVMKDSAGNTWFYGECRSDNDYRYLNIIDLKELKEKGEETSAPTFSQAFYDDVPVDAQSFWLSGRGDLFSTFPVSKLYHIGENGLPLTDDKDYTAAFWNIRTIQDVPAYTGTDFQEEAIVPAGTQLYVISTDEESKVTAETADGTRYQFYIDGSQWPHTINGTDIEELFDGLIFAG